MMLRMKIGDVEVFTLSEAAERYGIARKTLLTQIRRGIIDATMSGHNYLVTDTEMEKYVSERKGKPGTASPDHPQNKRGGDA
jgi:excisionase family DNA binding protein